MAWPHQESDWGPELEKVEPVFIAIVRAISRFQRVLLLVDDLDRVGDLLNREGVDQKMVTMFRLPCNDTWSRDFGPITVYSDGDPLLLDFGFNGWGLKFAADMDNLLTRSLHKVNAFGDTTISTAGLILEGGSIESDGNGTILTTSNCLLEPNRNPHLDQAAIEQTLKTELGARRFLWLENGYLAGDDTDSHIDTLARFAPDDTIVHVSCDDPADEHFPVISAMVDELGRFRTSNGRPYRLLPLPWPSAKYDRAGERLPATYANFLVINRAVLLPTYGDAKDAAAADVIRQAFPDREVITIDCLPLIEQHGSLHCITMQLPKGVLS